MIPPTPSEIAQLAFIRRNDPETAMKMAEEAGRATDRSLPITQLRLKELLSYDPETGLFKWNVRRGRMAEAGSDAGSPNSAGYTSIVIEGRRYQAHRLAWLWVHGSFPAGFIDHINCVRDDNRISNLREATVSQNIANAGLRSDNSSGFRGVCWIKSAKKWQARIKWQKVAYTLGYFAEIADAKDAYAKAAAELFGEFVRTEPSCLAEQSAQQAKKETKR